MVEQVEPEEVFRREKYSDSERTESKLADHRLAPLTATTRGEGHSLRLKPRQPSRAGSLSLLSGV